MLNGDYTTHYATTTSSFAMAGGGVLNAWVDYDGIGRSLTVYLAQNATKPASALLSHGVYLFTALGQQIYLGFSSSTWSGNKINEHDIIAVEFSLVN